MLANPIALQVKRIIGSELIGFDYWIQVQFNLRISNNVLYHFVEEIKTTWSPYRLQKSTSQNLITIYNKNSQQSRNRKK